MSENNMEEALKAFLKKMEKAAPGLAVDEGEGEGEGEGVCAGEFNLDILEMMTMIAALEITLATVTQDFLLKPERRAGAATFGLALVQLLNKLRAQFPQGEQE